MEIQTLPAQSRPPRMTDEILKLKDDIASARARVRCARLQEDYHLNQAQHAAVLYSVCLEELEKLEAKLAHQVRDQELGEPKMAWGWIERMK